jgi:hypothetical protein
MKLAWGLTTLALGLAVTPLGAADWKPKQGPLQTRWAKGVDPEKTHPEYPRPQLVRKDWLNLNGVWQLAFARQGEEPPFSKTNLPERILVPFPVESALSGVMKRGERIWFHRDRLWYRRTFTVPKAWAGQRVLLHFGAVDWEAVVWVNGRKLGTHQGGYDPFSFDITDALKDGDEQQLIVGVWDPTDKGPQPRGKQVCRPGGIYYTPITGIWQTVWLEPVPKVSIASLKIVPRILGGRVDVSVQLRGTADKAMIRAEVHDGDVQQVSAKGDASAVLTMRLQDVKLWSPQSPHLYPLSVDLLIDGKTVDHVDSYFGMRQVAIGKDDKGTMRLLLNGKPLFMVGPLDQGFWPDGLYTAPTDEALRYDVEVTKQLGFNMTRKHVKVEPARWYYWCDRLGLLVWQDMPSGDASVPPGRKDIERTPESAKIYERELKAMIDHLHNHPSIIMWVVFNEGWGQFDTQRITDWTKKYDPTRLVNNASGWNDRQAGDVIDVHVYPGPGAPRPEAKRASVLGEFGGLALAIDGHTWSHQTWGYRGTKSRDELTRKYELLLRETHRLKEDRGLCAAVYTQLTDVETEANGLLTYDRAIIKVDVERAAAVARGDFSRVPQVRVLVPTSEDKGQTWRYTVTKPKGDWQAVDFEDDKWAESVGGFGTKGTPGAVVRTEWKTDDIWIRRTFTLPEEKLGDVYLRLHHDENAEVYLNGVLAAKVEGYITSYEEVPITDEARATLKLGKNTIAIHCHQTTGGQYIDAGLVEVRKPRR